MRSNRPYLIRALYEWLVDCELTPHLLVDVSSGEVKVPAQYVRDNRIVLNIGPSAVKDLVLGNDLISFNARFGGTPMDVRVPPQAVLGIYARENGRGMLFPDDENTTATSSTDDEPEPPKPPRDRPTLKVVK